LISPMAGQRVGGHHVGVSRLSRDQVARALGRRVRQLRMREGLTVSGAARSYGATRRWWQHIEGGRVNPSLYVLAKLARVLGVRVRDLVD